MSEAQEQLLESLRWTLESLRLAGLRRIPRLLAAAAEPASSPTAGASAAGFPSGQAADRPAAGPNGRAIGWNEAARQLKAHVATLKPGAVRNGAAQPPAASPQPAAPRAGPPPPAQQRPAAAPQTPAPAARSARAGASGRAAAPDDSLRPSRPLDQAVEAQLAEVAGRVSRCTRCPALAANRSRTVFADGKSNADLMFIGEGPGEDEDRQGVPFVGRAGQLLTQIITNGMKMRREDCYIGNIVKCRPPENRAPTPEEAANCREYLERQIELVRPKVICCLGGVASRFLLDDLTPVGKTRGRWLQYRGIHVMVTYHPAYLLRNYTPEARGKVWDDVKKVVEKLRELRGAAGGPQQPAPRLF